jgi:hypothetical protein
VRVVAAPDRLGRVEGRVLADRDEDVLQARPLARVLWTLPVATVGTSSRRASAASPRLSMRSWRWNGRWSSTRNASRPERGEQPPHRRLVADPVARAPAEADEASACSSTSASVTRGASTTGPPSGAACARGRA